MEIMLGSFSLKNTSVGTRVCRGARWFYFSWGKRAGCQPQNGEEGFTRMPCLVCVKLEIIFPRWSRTD